MPPGPPAHVYEPMRLLPFDKIDSFEKLRAEGFVPYSLGPVYVYAAVSDCLPGLFAREQQERKKPEVLGGILQFQRPVLARCEDWNCVLEVMDAKSYVQFKKWLLAYQFIDRKLGSYYEPWFELAPVRDPLLWDLQRKYKAAALDVWSVSSAKAKLAMRADRQQLTDDNVAPLVVDFCVEPPDAGIQQRAAAALSILREL